MADKELSEKKCQHRISKEKEKQKAKFDLDIGKLQAEMDYEVHLMTVEEAVMALELSGQSALMFRNKSHDGLNMLHRRDDGSIGWVDPRGTRELTH